MRDVSYLPGAQREHQVRNIDTIAALAIATGWKIDRRGVTYLTCTREHGNETEQVSLALINGEISASRILVLNRTENLDTVTGWLEQTP